MSDMSRKSQVNALVDKISSNQRLEEFLSSEENIKSVDYEVIDSLFRKFILSKTQTSSMTDYIFDLFTPFIQINYKNVDNAYIILDLLEKGFFIYSEEIINKNLHLFNPAIKDHNDENCLMKILISPNENGKFLTFKKILSLSRENFNINQSSYLESYSKNSHENLLTYSLLIGNSEIASLLIENGASYKAKNQETGDNILHAAVKGKNPYCLNLLLNNLDYDVLRQLILEKNKSEETPYELSCKLNLTVMKKLLNDFLMFMKDKSPENFFENFEIPIEFLVQTNNNYIRKEQFEEKEKYVKENFYLNNWNQVFLDYLKLNKIHPENNNENGKGNENEQEQDEEEYIEILKNIQCYFKEEEEKYKDSVILLDSKKELYFYNYVALFYKLNDFEKIMLTFKNFYLDYKEKTLIKEFVFQSNCILMLIDLSIKNKIDFLSNFYIEMFTKFIKEISNKIQKEKLSDNPQDNNQMLTKKKLKWNYYLSKINVLNPLLLTYNNSDYCLKQIILLFLCYMNLEQKNLDKAKDYLLEIKKNFSEEKKNTVNKKINRNVLSFQNFLKRFYKILKIKYDYHQQSQVQNAKLKFYKHLISFKNFSMSSNSSLETDIFYFNTLGIKNLKEQKYSLALYNFIYTHKLIKKKYSLYQQYLPYALYNIALANFFLKKYEKSYQIFSQLKSLDVFINCPYLFYRLGVISMEKAISEEKLSNRNDNVNCLIQQVFNEKKDKILLVSSTNKNFISEGEDLNENFIEALQYFKQSILIIKGNTKLMKNCYKFCDDFEAFQQKKSNSNNMNNHIYQFERNQLKSFRRIYVQCYLNYIFCLLRTNQYTEVIYQCDSLVKEGEKSMLLENYLINAYLHLGEYKLAANLLSKKNFEEISKVKRRDSYYSTYNKTLYSNVSHVVAILVNFAKVQILNQNYVEAKNLIMKILGFFDLDNKNFEPPMYIINIVLYYLISVGKIHNAIELLKHRKILANLQE